VLGVPTLVIARTDADAADLITSDCDPYDSQFITGERTSEGFYRTHAWLLVAHYRDESIVKRWQQDPLWQMLTAAQNQQVASVDSNAWARMRGIFAAERIASDTVNIFHHQPVSDVK
jgi:isocitrate lyase